MPEDSRTNSKNSPNLNNYYHGNFYYIKPQFSKPIPLLDQGTVLTETEGYSSRGHICGDIERLKLFSLLVQTMMILGDKEHSGDWDLFLKITLNNGKVINTQMDYMEILFKDDKTIQIYQENADPLDEEEPIQRDIPIEDIYLISVTEP